MFRGMMAPPVEPKKEEQQEEQQKEESPKPILTDINARLTLQWKI